MSKVEIVLRAIMILMAEYKLNKKLESIILVTKAIEIIEAFIPGNKTLSDERSLLDKLVSLLKKIINGDLVPDESVMVELELILTEQPTLLKTFDKFIYNSNPEKILPSMRKHLLATLTKMEMKSFLLEVSKKLNRSSSDVGAISEEIIEKLNKLKKGSKLKDVALVDEVDFDNIDSLHEASDRAKELVSGGSALSCQWECINNMTQGGFRRGEFITVSALRHNYKSSFVKSIFLQMLMNNTPKLNDETKKPLMVFISLEEEIDNITFFFYSYLKYTLEGVTISNSDLKDLDSREVAEYVHKHATKNGFSIRIYRFIPELFDFAKLFDLIEKLENQGYEVIGCILDYVKKMSRNGVNRNGSMGTDLLEMFSRIRNFFSSKKIMFITPHQLSSDANALLRTGIAPLEFIEQVHDKNYYADSKQLGQEIDLELFLHKGKLNGKLHLFVGRGKHRIPTIAPEEYHKTALEFVSSTAPIPGDTDDVKPCTNPGVITTDGFDF